MKIVEEKSWNKRAFILRITVISFLLGAAVVLAVLSYLALTQYDANQANTSFENVAYSAIHALERGFVARQNGVLSVAKNMAYLKPNETEWPNVAMPGFYDSSVALQRAANLGEVTFMPLVLPAQLSSFETFLADYFLSDPNIPLNASNIDQYYRGVFSLNSAVGPLSNRTYHDTTGVSLLFESPNNILVPLTQYTFTDFFGLRSLALNVHSTPEFGSALDSIIECSEHTEYEDADKCVDITTMVTLPLGAAPEDIKHGHSMMLQPVYLNQSTSQLVGFVGGGFDWGELLSPLFSLSKEGIDIVVTNGDLSLTYATHEGGVVYRGYGDLHSRSFDSQEVAAPMFKPHNHRGVESTYIIRMYPTQEYVDAYKTDTPIFVSTILGGFMLLCALVFFQYDRFMRHAAHANEVTLETKRRFVRFISHEIRTPLNALHLGLEALTSELSKTVNELSFKRSHSHDSLPSQETSPSNTMLLTTLRGWQELSAEMMGNSESAVDVLNDLLNYDKIEMGTLRLEFAFVSIWETVQSIAAAFVSPAKNKNIHISCDNLLGASRDDLEDQDFSSFVVVGDAARLSQVLRNLISNAIKFTPESGTISVRVQRVDARFLSQVPYPEGASSLFQHPRAGSVRISIADSGVGLTVEQLTQICSEGVQFNANELQAGQGSGLGLFITKGIVEQHGGRLTVASAGIGAGTTFSVELPLFQDPRSENQRSVTPQSPYRGTPEHKIVPESILPAFSAVGMPVELALAASSIKRILVVDDAASNRKMLIRILTSNGYICEQAEDGQQAIDVYRTSLVSGDVFDAIIMDFEMPVMNGPTAAKVLRDMGCTLPVLGVTGNLLPEDVQYYKEQGATDVFGKPLSLARFEEFMRKCGVC